jgi:L-ascorbate metabolism protein UlaG (beta-lactamase superfamily)
MRKFGLWFLVSTALLAAGCFGRRTAKGPGDRDYGVEVRWHGHSCFSFRDSTGRLFLIDPFDETVGYPLAWVDPDAVLVTHGHFDHDHLRRTVKYELVESTGVHVADGVEVTGIPGYHDDRQGAVHGATRFFVWEMGGIRFAHLGDVGQKTLTPEQIVALEDPDVLFVPVGGRTTVDGEAAAEIARGLKAPVVVPMHYGNERVRFFEFEPVDPFIERFDAVRRLSDSSFHVRRADLPDTQTVFVPALPSGKK